eukprot:487176-Alexandrium_andersonii.AAC.1
MRLRKVPTALWECRLPRRTPRSADERAASTPASWGAPRLPMGYRFGVFAPYGLCDTSGIKGMKCCS